jgi:hypothetical protein
MRQWPLFWVAFAQSILPTTYTHKTTRTIAIKGAVVQLTSLSPSKRLPKDKNAIFGAIFLVVLINNDNLLTPIPSTPARYLFSILTKKLSTYPHGLCQKAAGTLLNY